MKYESRNPYGRIWLHVHIAHLETGKSPFKTFTRSALYTQKLSQNDAIWLQGQGRSVPAFYACASNQSQNAEDKHMDVCRANMKLAPRYTQGSPEQDK